MAKVVCVEFRGVNDTFKMIGSAIGNVKNWRGHQEYNTEDFTDAINEWNKDYGESAFADSKSYEITKVWLEDRDRPA